LPREHGKRFTVDLFFRSLPITHGPHSVAIVLSGADGDGALGIATAARGMPDSSADLDPGQSAPRSLMRNAARRRIRTGKHDGDRVGSRVYRQASEKTDRP